MVEFARTISRSRSSIDLFGFVRSFVREPDKSALEGSGFVRICSDLFEMRVSGLHDDLEGGWLCEDVFGRRIPVGFELIGHESDAHSEAVDKVQGLHHAGDERIAVVGLRGEILGAGLTIEVAGVVEFNAFGVLSAVERFRPTSVLEGRSDVVLRRSEELVGRCVAI